MSYSPSLDPAPVKDSSPVIDASTAKTTPKQAKSVMAVADVNKDRTPLDHKLATIQTPPRKRQKTGDNGGGATSESTLRAPGSALLELPLDVLLEILTHVDPMSLRHVSRTSRALRNTLTGPRSDWIWRASYANTDHGLPPAPDDMTVPQFLSLLVDRVCDFCHASLIPKDQIKRIWAARIKCCLHCLYHSRNIVHEKDMDIFYLVRLIQRHLGPEFPLYKVFPASEDLGRSRSYPWVHINRLNQDYVRDKVGGGSVDDIKAWILQQAERHESVIKHAEACYEWERQEYWKRWEKEQDILAERLKAIDQRLKDLDIDVDEPQEFKKQLSTRLTTYPTPPNYRHKYFPTPAYSTPIEIHNLVREARPLTEEDWSILSEWLLDAAKAEKRRQILEGRYSAFKKAYYQFLDRKSYRRQCLFPSICTVANWEEVVDLIEGTPLEQHLAADDMRAFIGKLARERFSQWRATFETELVAKLNAADPTREQPATVADLELATSVFSHRDSSSGDPLRYPELLSWAPFSGDSFYPPDGSYYVVRKCSPWSAHEVRVDGWRRRLTARLVAMAGLDPATATYQEMSMQSVWFGRADEVSKLHCGEPAYLHRFSLTMCCAREKVDEYVVFTEAGVELARAWLQNPSALMCS